MKKTSYTSVAISFLFVFLFAGFFSGLQAQDDLKAKWLTFNSNRGNFKIKMPGTPELKQEDKDYGKTYKAQLKTSEYLYYVSYSVHNKALPDPQYLCEVSVKAFLTKIGGELLKNEEWKLKKNIGRKVDIEVSEKGIFMRYHVVIVGNIQYQVVLAGETEITNKIEKKYFKTFKILD